MHKIGSIQEEPLLRDARHAGREAFRQHGVTGVTMHSYARDSAERLAFRSGFSDEQFRAAERAQAEAVNYHALTVRDAPKDRAWAEKLAARA